jgi:CubicO group peptidase (beta-lactamase class C family)
MEKNMEKAMSTDLINRRDLVALGMLAAIPGGWLLDAKPAVGAPSSNASGMRALDRFIAGYCAAMNAPGLTLGLANANGPIRVSAYGYVDLAAKTPVSTSHLFEIGSITKSFVALIVLQLHEEGKIDLHAPIRDHLPWLAIETDFGEVLVHHLLTHSSGMPDDAPVIPIRPGRRPRQAFKPGSQFLYSNWGYDVLGHLIATIDRRPWPAAVAERILKPVGMSDTAPSITSAMRARIAQSYMPLHDDRPTPRLGPLVPAGNLTVEAAAGSIASTPADMALYMQMILNRGVIRGGRIISEDSFRLFTTPYIAAPSFGPGASYGYGIAIDKLDGHVRLRHTGGMVSFMSAIQMDLDSGTGAFASINAQLGYRPNPVAELALRLLRSDIEHTKPPAIPAYDESAKVDAAESYAGVYTSAGGRRLEVTADADRLFLILAGGRAPLQQADPDIFIADHAGFDLFPLVFERDPHFVPKDSTDTSKGSIIAIAYGSDRYVASRYKDQIVLEPSPDLDRYVGKFYSEDPWHGTVRVVQRQRQLWLDGTDPLTPIGDNLFRVGAQPTSPEVAEFSGWIGEIPHLLFYDGGDFRRIGEANS